MSGDEDRPESRDREDREVEGRFGYRPPPDPPERPDLIEGYDPPPGPAEPMAEPDRASEPAEPDGGDE